MRRYFLFLLVMGLFGLAPAGSLASPEKERAFNAQIDKAETELDQKTRPFVGAYGSGFRDSNDIRVLHGGAHAGATLLDAVNLRLQAMTGQLHQDAKGSRQESDIWRTAVSLGVVDLFLTPRIVVWGALGYEGFQLQNPSAGFSPGNDGSLTPWRRTPMYRGYVLDGKLGAKYIFDNESEVGVEAKRESMWSGHDTFDTRLFNRITDMTRMAPDMAVDRARVFTNVVTFPEQRLRVEGGLDSMEDGNLRKWVYAHYQIPVLWSQDKHWTVLRPNFYAESCDENKSGYFSPDSHITVGLMLHTIQDFGPIEVEAEVNPKLLWTKDQTKKGDTQEGVHGLLNIAYKYESLRIGVGGFLYTDTEGYWLNRGNLFVKYSF
ncbi:hypothetical protein JCM15519_31700 [Fundidesulfovibrio butyratiphilus]